MPTKSARRKRTQKPQANPTPRAPETPARPVTPLTASPVRMGLAIEIVYSEIYDRVHLETIPISVGDSGYESVARLYPPKRAFLFSLPLGQGGKTLRDTALCMAGQLPEPCRFTVHYIDLAILENGRPVSPSERIWWESTFEFYVGDKWYLRLPAHRFREKPLALSTYIYIEERQSFSGVFECQWAYDPARKFEVLVHLAGELQRGIS